MWAASSCTTARRLSVAKNNDPLNFTPPQFAVIAIEVILVLFGLFLLVRHLLVRRTSTNAACELLSTHASAQDPQWPASWFDFALFVWFVISGGLLAQISAIQILASTSLSTDLRQIIAGALFQLGMLAGVFGFRWRSQAGRDFPSPRIIPSFWAGFQAFAIALPLVLLAGIGWTTFLESVGIPLQRQELVDLFAGSKAPLQIGFMVFFATLIAPYTEELIFRAGIFRFLRTRIPRFAALLLPALLFAGLHANLASFAQLLVLGVVFALAYERTNNIGVAMCAHACFNLNTIILLLAGIDA